MDAATIASAMGGRVDWRRSQPKIPSRNEAIRLLLRRALERSSEKSEPAVAERDGAAKSAV
jgi:hypothetical protein